VFLAVTDGWVHLKYVNKLQGKCELETEICKHATSSNTACHLHQHKENSVGC
jgi:hypothetical protein